MMRNHEIRIGDITFDALDTRRMAEFWARALGYEVQVVTEEFAAVIDPERRMPRCCFQKVETSKVGKNRVHLDLFVADMEAEVERLVGLGAQVVGRRGDGDVVWTTMLDVEGNEFCVQLAQW